MIICLQLHHAFSVKLYQIFILLPAHAFMNVVSSVWQTFTDTIGCISDERETTIAKSHSHDQKKSGNTGQ